ncbi:MAG: ribosome recycling factor [Oscillospiraceae bacterium]|jgi:ribosome recycling factor|nr:ribosome recycling factor [Oscillospiraceae bacterium]
MNKSDYNDYRTRMDKTVEVMKSEFASVRAGRANPGVLDQIRVDYFGTPTPISQVATVSVPDPRTIAIQPWDAGSLKPIEKAIQASDLGINPNNDGRIIRLSFPQLTEERRKELSKQVKGIAEESKVAIRNIRRDAIEKFKAQKKTSEITEDDLKDAEKEMQTITDDYVKKIDTLTAAKDKELATV